MSNDLDKCPGCGGYADNGHDREYPPNPYYCTKCTNIHEGTAMKPITYLKDVDGGYWEADPKTCKMVFPVFTKEQVEYYRQEALFEASRRIASQLGHVAGGALALKIIEDLSDEVRFLT